MFLPSSIMGEWQKEQRTLQGRWWDMDFEEGSYHSRPVLFVSEFVW